MKTAWVIRGIGWAAAALLATTALAGPEDDFNRARKSMALGDLITAMSQFRLAADAGHVEAQKELAFILDGGDEDDEARYYFARAAMGGNAEAQYGFARMLSSGEGGDKDFVRARHWLAAAADQGHEASISVLSSAYVSGGLELTPEERQSPEAVKWVRKGAGLRLISAVEWLIRAYDQGDFGLVKTDPEYAQLQAVRAELLAKPKEAPKRRHSATQTK